MDQVEEILDGYTKIVQRANDIKDRKFTRFVEYTLVFILSFPVMMLSGLILSHLWSWFVVPLGISAIGLWHAVGLNILVSTLRFSVSLASVKGSNIAEAGERIIQVLTLVLGLLMFWGIGFLVHLIM